MHLSGILCGMATVLYPQSRAAMNTIRGMGRDSFCSRCRHFEDGDADPSVEQHSMPPLPQVPPPCTKGFEAFQGSGRRLGSVPPSGQQQSPSTPAIAASVAEANDVV
jgi:hypothetical protein